MNEISVNDQHLVYASGSWAEAHTKSSLTLCRPEGKDLYSTTPSISTALGLAGFQSNAGRTLTLRDRPEPCYGVTDGIVSYPTLRKRPRSPPLTIFEYQT